MLCRFLTVEQVGKAAGTPGFVRRGETAGALPGSGKRRGGKGEKVR